MTKVSLVYALFRSLLVLILLLAAPGDVRPTTGSVTPATEKGTATAAPAAPSPAETKKNVATATSAPTACRQLSAKELKKKKHDANTIRKIQACYKEQGWYSGPVDGIVGSLTMAAMQRSCSGRPEVLAAPADGLGVVYRLSKDDLEWMKSKNDVMDKLDALQNVEFNNRYDFASAVKASIGDKYDQYRDMILEAAEQTVPVGSGAGDAEVTFMLSDVFFAEQKATNLPEKLVEKLAELQDSEYVGRDLFINALRIRVETPLVKDGELEAGSYEKNYEPLILERARKEETFDRTRSISLDGWSCGCVRDDLTGEVYGFLPFWKAGAKQKLDFSVLTRIGYFALTFDDKGAIAKRFDLTQERSGFINTARKYNTSVDLVIYNNDWRAWSRMLAAKQTALGDTLIDNIIAVVTEQQKNSLLNRIKPWITLGGTKIPLMADGVTLYFDGYPRDDAASEYLTTFIKKLKSKLKEQGTRYGWYFNLNVVLPMDEIGKGIYRTEYLRQLVPDVEKSELKQYNAKNDVDLFIVFLNEPTSEKKKDMRREIEGMLKGIQRRNMLRKIIPVLNPAVQPLETADSHQFFDDLVYFEDNFGGVGFWPVPDSAMKGAADINRQIAIAFKDTGYDDFLHGALSKYIPSYCRVVGPNRWLVRIAFDILGVFLLTYFILSFWIFELRIFFRKWFWWFLGLGIVAIFLQCSLFACDPYWKYRRSEVIFLVFVAGLFAAIWVYVRKMKESDYP